MSSSTKTSTSKPAPSESSKAIKQAQTELAKAGDALTKAAKSGFRASLLKVKAIVDKQVEATATAVASKPVAKPTPKAPVKTASKPATAVKAPAKPTAVVKK